MRAKFEDALRFAGVLAGAAVFLAASFGLGWAAYH